LKKSSKKLLVLAGRLDRGKRNRNRLRRYVPDG